MQSRFWTAVGVLLTVAMIVLSAFINYSFGYSLGTTEANARIFGGVSVVAVGVMAVLPLRISVHWAARRKVRALIGATVFLILAAYAIAGSVGFGMANRSQLAGSQENLNAQLNDAIHDRDPAAEDRKGLGEPQPAATVTAKIDAAQKDRRWDLTQGCTNATAPSSRDFCQGVDHLRGELANAATAAVLGQKIQKLNFSIEQLRKQGAGLIADPQSFGFAVLFGVEQDRVRTVLSILLALVVENVCCFGLVVIVGARPGQELRERITLPEWFGKWLTDRAEPHLTARVSFSELEADFRGWADARAAPKLRSRKFARLLRAACQELGLAVEDQTVVDWPST
jgi:hypothetical protein